MRISICGSDDWCHLPKFTSKELRWSGGRFEKALQSGTIIVAPLIARRNRYARRVLPNGFVRRTRDTANLSVDEKGFCLSVEYRA